MVNERCGRCGGMLAEDYQFPGEVSCRSCGRWSYPATSDIPLVLYCLDCDGSFQVPDTAKGKSTKVCGSCQLVKQRAAEEARKGIGGTGPLSISTQCQRCGATFTYKKTYDYDGKLGKKQCGPCRRIVGGHSPPELAPTPELGQMAMGL